MISEVRKDTKTFNFLLILPLFAANIAPEVPNYDQEPMVLVFNVNSILTFLVDYTHTYSSIYKRQV